MPKCDKKVSWNRKEEESEKAYEAFTLYRDMGLERTISAVAQKLHKSYTLIRRWKDKWNWDNRVRDYDNELEKETRSQAIKEYKDMKARHVSMAMAVQKKAMAALSNLSIADMSPRDIREYIRMATDLERLNRGIEENQRETVESEIGLADAIMEAYKKRRGDDDA